MNNILVYGCLFKDSFKIKSWYGYYIKLGVLLNIVGGVFKKKKILIIFSLI